MKNTRLSENNNKFHLNDNVEAIYQWVILQNAQIYVPLSHVSHHT